MGYLYQLIPNAFTILSDSYAKIGEIGYEAATITNSPKQPVLEDQLIHCSSLFYLIDSLVVLNDDGDAIIGINADADLINALLLQLRDACGLNVLSQFPTPLTTLDFNTVNGSTYPVGGLGAILQSNGATYLPLEMGAPGEVLTASPTGLVWSAVVGNGIPSGGTTGQYLEKINNTSYNVQWATLTVSKITDLTATAAEINILDGVVGVTAAEISYLANVSSDIQTQFTGKLGTALNDGQIFIGNASNVATAVTTSGVIGLTNTGVFSIVNDSIVDADINTAAGITRSKLATGTANRLVINSSIGVMTDAAIINPSVVLVSDANGIPTHSATATATLGYLDISSSLQASLDERLVVNLSSVAQGDVLVYNGTDWINLALGTTGQVLQSNGTTVVWGSAAANGLPTGGTDNQILRKIDGTDYNTEWHTFVLADVTDVSTTFTELNLLSGLTVNSSLVNLLSGATGNIQTQITARLVDNLAYHAIYIGGPSNTAQQVGPGAESSVLTIVAGHPTWQTPPTPGTFSGPGTSTDNAIVRFNGTSGDSGQDSGVLIDDLNNMTFPTGTAIRTSTSAGNTLLLQAYDVDGAAYTTFATLTANNTPAFDLNTSTTIGTAAIYRVGGTDVAVADGGTAISSYTAGDLLYATGATTLAKLPIGTNGFVLSVVAGAPAWLAAGSGSGTVTDFSAGDLSPLFTTSVATSTTTPALTFSLTNAGANTYFGNATGGAAAPSYTAAAALTKTDDTNVTLTLGGAPTTALLTAASITLGWTGTLAVARGGTGLGSLGTATQLIRVNAGATALEYFTPTFISGNQTITLSGDVTGSGTTAITTAIDVNKVLDTMIRQSAGLSVVGRSANSTGNVADITGSDGQVLRVSGTTLGFGTVLFSSLASTPTTLAGYGITDAWSSASGATLTATNTITSNAANRILFTGTWTTTASAQYHLLFNPTITPRATASDTLSAFAIRPTITATANSQRLAILDLDGTLADGGFATTELDYIYSGNFKVNVSGTISSGSSANAPKFGAGGSTGFVVTNTSMRIEGRVTTGNLNGINLNQASSISLTSGAISAVRVFSQFQPVTGTATHTLILAQPTYNQTGGTGYVAFMDYDPLVSSLTGIHYGLLIRPSTISSFAAGGTPTDAFVVIGAGTTVLAPLKLTTGTNLTAQVAGVFEYDNTLWFTQSDATRRQVMLAANATKTTAGAPYANDGYVTVRIGGTDVRLMTTA